MTFMLSACILLSAIKRLGGGKTMSSAERWKVKKMNKGAAPAATTTTKEDMLKLTGLADKLVQQGNLEIYQFTYEKLNFEIKEEEDKKAAAATVIPEGTSAEDALDMFADDLDKDTDRGKKDGQTKENDDSVTEKTESSKSQGNCEFELQEEKSVL